jgi:hypothetical protein
MISELDLDALRRALLWGRDLQRREPQLRLFPDPMPAEGSTAWLSLAQYFASLAQAHVLGLRPWQCEPASVDDDAVADGGWGRKPDEIRLRQIMREHGISKFEPNPPSAIANAEAGADARPRRKARRR